MMATMKRKKRGTVPGNEAKKAKKIEGRRLFKLVGELPSGAPLYLHQGRNDETVPFSHVGMLAKALPHATIRRLKGRDHQLNNDLSEVARDISLLG
jgi:fermentation-respiration switch protein FrsA (DUF1100 family)